MQTENKNPATVDPFAVVLGGVEIEVTLRTGAKEKVKVRQLPFRLLRNWSACVGDEAALVELYCDKISETAQGSLRKLGGEAASLISLIQRADNSEEVRKLHEDLAVVQAGIDKIQRDNSWDDELTPESHDEIIRIGYALNRPRFDRWMQSRDESVGHLKQTYRKYLPDHPLLAPLPGQPNQNGEVTISEQPRSSAPTAASSSENPTPK